MFNFNFNFMIFSEEFYGFYKSCFSFSYVRFLMSCHLSPTQARIIQIVTLQ